ncbi:cyclic nucleotide-binding domain-containing protein [Chryseobacterium gallinarum]|uniref:cyclic nucleotide-binding domain-containing protein n=1 Tax=Chryseobacterium gallinarum TaxID=1324352 RepID=UPI0020240350|nr:cyclic nucleotide-binding domain-containing protein [Chryseobacterium gallinarum]MCL8538650.1 cyclic nucleotide-binding domain-containing protein [Chryseobacterium gallinarum]
MELCTRIIPQGEFIFQMGDRPHYYFQIVNGIVEVNNYHTDGKEFTLNILTEGQSIGGRIITF